MDIFSMLEKEKEEKHISLAKEVTSFLGSTIRKVKRNYFYASEISEKACLRTLVYAQLTGCEEKISGGTQRIWDVGNSMHDDYNEYFEKMGILLGKEVAFRKNGISGRIDNLVAGKKVHKIRVVELKTMRSDQWNAMQLPPEGYEGQILIYLWAVVKASKERLSLTKKKKGQRDDLDRFVTALSPMFFEEPPEGVLFIENKDTQVVKEFFYPYKEYSERITKLLGVVEEVKDFLAQKLLPKRRCLSKTDYGARYCSYKDICFTDRTFKEVEEGGK